MDLNKHELKKNKKKYIEQKLKQKFNYHISNLVITEKDFYPPDDKRYLKSGVQDIKGGDNFADYAKYYFDLYGDVD